MGTLVVENLGKGYKRYPQPWWRFVEWLSLGRRKFHQFHWVLRSIGFTVAAGEAVGIIGQNGAGKSTLLRLITGAADPTEGQIEVSGRVAALLELGMGFHPDFTGRQNVLIAGQLLGFDTAEITSRLPEIEAFAEIGDYIDRPVRSYSSGMQVRLAFSVATAIRPDILIVDEALSVGDLYFQHKCFARIREFKEQGTTLLFVSHDLAAIKTLCDRTILIDGGLLIKDGPPDSVLDYYNAIIARQEADHAIQQVESEAGTATRSGNGKATLLEVDMVDGNGRSCRAFPVAEPAGIIIRYRLNADIDDLVAGVLLRDRVGNDVFGTNTHFHADTGLLGGKTGDCRELRLSLPLNLGVGSYSVSIALHRGMTHVEECYDWQDKAIVFQMLPDGGPAFIGSTYLPATFSTE